MYNSTKVSYCRRRLPYLNSRMQASKLSRAANYGCFNTILSTSWGNFDQNVSSGSVRRANFDNTEPKLLAIGREIDECILETQRRQSAETVRADPMQAARDDDVAHVFEEYYTSKCYDKNVQSLKKLKREEGNGRAAASQNNDSDYLAEISEKEETLTKAIKMEN